jgi:predicted peptidase
MTTIIAALGGILLMTQSSDQIHIEPGKQLPQSVTVRSAEKPGSDVTIRYMLFVPTSYRPDGPKLPLMLFLHGFGECSNDDLSRVKIHGPAKIVENQPDFPFVLISPQCPPPTSEDATKPLTPPELNTLIQRAWKADQLIQLIDHVANQLNVDNDRVYVTGLSMGGYGTWRLAATYPERFAAAVPICGGGEPKKMAKPLSKLPIWAFHGAKDTVVLPSESQNMVNAIRRENGNLLFTMYPNADHNSWAPTYDDPKIYDWLLAQRRAK